MKFKKLISALTLGTALSSFALGAVSCASVQDEDTSTIDGFNELEDYESKDAVDLESTECTIAVRSTFIIPIRKAPGDVKYTFSSSNGAVAKVVTDTGFVVAISVGDATIIIKGSDNTYGEFIVHVKEEVSTSADSIGTVQQTGSSSLSPTMITANVADTVTIARNEKLDIEFGFDVGIEEMAEAYKYQFSYDFYLDSSSINNDASASDYEQLKGAQGALSWYGTLNRYLVVSDGENSLKAGTYLLVARAQTLSKQITVVVEDNIIINDVKFATAQDGIASYVTIEGYQTNSITPIFYPGINVTYTLTSMDTSIVNVDSIIAGGSAIISGKKVGSTLLRLDVNEEGSKYHFRRYFPVVVKEVFVKYFGGIRFLDHAKYKTKGKWNKTNDDQSMNDFEHNTGKHIPERKLLVPYQDTRFQAMASPTYATDIYYAGSVFFFLQRPLKGHQSGRDYTYKYGLEPFSIPGFGQAFNSSNTPNEGQMYRDIQGTLHGKCTVYDNSVVSGTLKVEKQKAKHDSSHTSATKKESVITGLNLMIFTNKVWQLYTTDSNGNEVEDVIDFGTRRDEIDYDHKINENTSKSTDDSKYEKSAKKYLNSTYADVEKALQGAESAWAENGGLKMDIGVGQTDAALIATKGDNGYYSDYFERTTETAYTQGSAYGTSSTDVAITESNQYSARAKLPVIYLEINDEFDGDLSDEDIIFTYVIFDAIPTKTSNNISNKSVDYVNLPLFAYNTSSTSSPYSVSVTRYTLKKYIKGVSTRSVNTTYSHAYSGVWNYIDLSEKGISVGSNPGTEKQYETWVFFRFVSAN